MTTKELKEHLKEARRDLKAAQKDYFAHLKDPQKRLALHQALQAARHTIADLHRRLAEQTDEPFVVPLELRCVPDPAVSGAVLLQDEQGAVLVFNACRQEQDGMRHSCGTALVRFERLLISKFGLPNDEAMRGHPLYDRGLDIFFDVSEVLGSPWLKEAQAHNQIPFPSTSWVGKIRHLVFCFHDASFECLARDLQCTLTDEHPQHLLKTLVGSI